MLLSDFLADKRNAHKEQGNPVVACNALYKAAENFNCYLTAAQAIALARNLLQKAQLILDEKLDDAVVHMWNKGKANEKLYCGLNQARKGPRRKKKASAETDPDDSESAASPMPDVVPITRQQIDELLRFLPLLGAPGPETEPTWQGLDQNPASGTFVMPYPVYPPAVEEFFELASHPCWTDYNYASTDAGERLRDDTAIASASLDQIKSMLTFCVRGERFCDGHWGAMVNEGRVGAILRRLQQLRDEAPEA
jgi:hypothetical protein